MERLDREAQSHIQTCPQFYNTATAFTRQGKPDLIIAQNQIETIEDDVTFPNIHYKWDPSTMVKLGDENGNTIEVSILEIMCIAHTTHAGHLKSKAMTDEDKLIKAGGKGQGWDWL